MRSLTPAQVHQIGLDEVARIQDGMRAVAKDLGYQQAHEDPARAQGILRMGEGARRHVLQVARGTARDLPGLRRQRRAGAAEVFQPAAQDRLRSAAGRAVPRSVGVRRASTRARRSTANARDLLRECLRPEGAAALGAGVAVAARSGAGSSLPDLAAARARRTCRCSAASRATPPISKAGACTRSISATRWASTRIPCSASARSTPSCGAPSAW